MKVICIKEARTVVTGFRNLSNALVVGEEYNVISNHLYDGDNYYLLREIPFVWYCSKLFAPISNIDETEFVRNYNKELV